MIAPGHRLGPYEVVALIGQGGMGEVYRATDAKLKRQVAIKILPPALAADRDRLARFQREAEVLASLNHPNIAGIYGIEETDGSRALIMELVEGEDLSTMIARGPILVAEALPIARQIAEALEAAHERGIVHRDLKPANIKVRADGTVKVLDFGLAKALAQDSAGAALDAADSPTVTSPAMTQVGVLLGTAAYVSPEQARGKPVDKRADIWAFGCVLYEMLTGRRAFSGETASDAVAAILSRDPDWLALPAETPESVRRLLRRSLEKDPRRRLHDIADARIELEETLAQPSAAGLVAPDPSAAIITTGARARTRVRLAWIAATLSVAAIVAALALGPVGPFRRPAEDTRVFRSSIVLPEGAQIPGDRSSANLGPGGRFALSPDGRRLAFVARREPTKEDDEAAATINRVQASQSKIHSTSIRGLGFKAFGKIETELHPFAKGRQAEVAGQFVCSGNRPSDALHA